MYPKTLVSLIFETNKNGLILTDWWGGTDRQKARLRGRKAQRLKVGLSLHALSPPRW